MSSDSEKWLLVEWGNGVRGVVHSRYMVNRGKLDLKAGCTITISKRGEQQLATYIARSNDRQLLEQIANDEAGPSAPPDPEVRDFSPSASDWEPSGDEGTDSEVEMKKPKVDLVLKRTPRENRAKKVIKPSNKVKAIVPNTLRKVQQTNMKTYVNCRKRPRESETYIPENNNTQPTNKNTPPSNNLNGPPKLMTVTFDANIIVGILGALNKMAQCLAKFSDKPSQNRVENEIRNIPLVIEESDEESTHSDESNRSDDNVLISNKYVNMQSNGQVNESLMDVQQQQSIANITQQEDIMHETQEENNCNETLTTVADATRNQSIANETLEQNVNTSVEQLQKILNDSLTQKENIINNTQPQAISNSTLQRKVTNDVQDQNDDKEWVPIGSGKTFIHKEKFKKIKWNSYTVATRTLLQALFPRRTLATHSLTGKKSPAFQNKPAKMCLDPKKIADIIIEVMDRFNVKENLVRSIITTKCADESKMFRNRLEKKKNLQPKLKNIQNQPDFNKENS